MDEDKTTLDDLITYIQNEMSKLTPDCEEYISRLNQLERLYAIQGKNAPACVSPDTLYTVAGNVLVVLVIVGYERSHVMLSKALTLLKRS